MGRKTRDPRSESQKGVGHKQQKVSNVPTDLENNQSSNEDVLGRIGIAL